MRPLSIVLFTWAFGLSCIVSLWLAWVGGSTGHFGFAMPAEAARTLATRILWVRLAGIGFALTLMGLVVIGRSQAARGALVLRWFLGLATSVAFLHGIGVLLPSSPGGSLPLVASAAQLAIEGLAILILFGEDAASWFAPRRAY